VKICILHEWNREFFVIYVLNLPSYCGIFTYSKKESLGKKQILLFLQSLWFSGVCFGRTDSRLRLMRSFSKSAQKMKAGQRVSHAFLLCIGEIVF